MVGGRNNASVMSNENENIMMKLNFSPLIRGKASAITCVAIVVVDAVYFSPLIRGKASAMI